jgi:rRNA maturation RNase YbeY
MKNRPPRGVRIRIANRQRKFSVSIQRIEALVRFLMERCTALRPDRPWADVLVILADDPKMAGWKQEVFGRDEATDVISLRYAPMPPETGHTGELMVNVERAVRVSAALGRVNPSRELALYLAHAIDHLSDADDDTPAARQRMRRRELRWLAQADRTQMTQTLISKPHPRPADAV